MIHVTYEPMKGISFDVAGPHPMERYLMDRYTWGDD
jgi:hypothetical protein